jgi:hypothetical protein
VLGDVEAFAFGLDIGAQADDHVDDLVEDRRADARYHQRGADAPALRDHLGDQIVVRDLAGGVIHDARAAEGRIHQDAGAERADDAAGAVDAEHVERVVVAERVLHHGAEEQADHADDQTEHDGAHRTGITGRRRHRDEARHRARQRAEHGGMALDDPLREHPRQRRRRSRDETFRIDTIGRLSARQEAGHIEEVTGLDISYVHLFGITVGLDNFECVRQRLCTSEGCSRTKHKTVIFSNFIAGRGLLNCVIFAAATNMFPRHGFRLRTIAYYFKIQAFQAAIFSSNLSERQPTRAYFRS